MPRLPSARDVSNVNPRIASDPGIKAPTAAFSSTVGTVAQELVPAVDTFARVAQRQENRRDAIHSSGLINQRNQEFDLQLRKLNTEADLSDEKVLQGFGAFMAERINNAIEEHREQGASEDSIARLTLRLRDVESAAIGRAGAISAQLGREKVKTTFGNALSPLVQRAAQSPTLENIDQLFVGLETQIVDIQAALDPSEEETFRRAGREQIVLSAVDSLIARGRVESAESILDDGNLFNFMSADKQRDVRRKIDTVRFSQEETLRKISQAELVLGRPLTQTERLRMLGLDANEKLTERQRRIQELMARGISPELSEDIAANDIRVVGPDPFGTFYSVNVVTNESQPVIGKDAKVLSGILSEVKPGQKQNSKGETKLEQDVTKGTGPFAAIQSSISNIIGPFMEGTLFEETTDARQSVRLFSQIAKTGLINNPRFPVAEQNIVKELLPDVSKFFVDPDRARADLKKLNEFLIDSRESKTSELIRGKTTTERKGELTDQISRIDELLSLMNTPATNKKDENVVTEGTVIKNRHTGERLIMRDGKWVPHGG